MYMQLEGGNSECHCKRTPSPRTNACSWKEKPQNTTRKECLLPEPCSTHCWKEKLQNTIRKESLLPKPALSAGMENFRIPREKNPRTSTCYWKETLKDSTGTKDPSASSCFADHCQKEKLKE